MRRCVRSRCRAAFGAVDDVALVHSLAQNFHMPLAWLKKEKRKKKKGKKKKVQNAASDPNEYMFSDHCYYQVQRFPSARKEYFFHL